MDLARVTCLAVVLLSTAGCRWGAPEPLTDGQRSVVEANLLDRVPETQYRVMADLGGEVTYVGLDADPVPVVPGRPLSLVHYWRVDRLVFDWEVFVHVVPTAGAARINGDHVPVSGLHPASRWERGQIVRDEHEVEIPATVTGSVSVLVGLWHGSRRIEVESGPEDVDGRVIAATLPVGKAGTP